MANIDDYNTFPLFTFDTDEYRDKEHDYYLNEWFEEEGEEGDEPPTDEEAWAMADNSLFWMTSESLTPLYKQIDSWKGEWHSLRITEIDWDAFYIEVVEDTTEIEMAEEAWNNAFAAMDDSRDHYEFQGFDRDYRYSDYGAEQIARAQRAISALNDLIMSKAEENTSYRCEHDFSLETSDGDVIFRGFEAGLPLEDLLAGEYGPDVETMNQFVASASQCFFEAVKEEYQEECREIHAFLLDLAFDYDLREIKSHGYRTIYASTPDESKALAELVQAKITQYGGSWVWR